MQKANEQIEEWKGNFVSEIGFRVMDIWNEQTDLKRVQSVDGVREAAFSVALRDWESQK